MSEGSGNGCPAITQADASPLNGVVPPADKRFQPGQSGNPKGMIRGARQVKRRLRNEVLRYCRDNPSEIPMIAASLVQEARTRPETIIEGDGADKTVRCVGAGWAQAQKLIWDRLDGPLEKTVNVNARMIAKVIVRGE